MMEKEKVDYFEVCPEIIEAAMKQKRIEEYNKKVESMYKKETNYREGEEDVN